MHPTKALYNLHPYCICFRGLQFFHLAQELQYGASTQVLEKQVFRLANIKDFSKQENLLTFLHGQLAFFKFETSF